MANDLAKPESAKPDEVTRESLAKTIETVSGLPLHALATVFVQSHFFKDTTSLAQAIVKIVAGRELGLGPMESMRGLYVHDGHVGLAAQLVASKLRQTGKYDYKLLHCDDAKCEIEFLRLRDGQWAVEGVSAYAIDDAQKAGLVREGSGWVKNPSDMLFARAFTRGQRRYAPDVFNVTVYSVEELQDIKAETEAGSTDMMPKRKSALAVQPGEVPGDPASAPAGGNGGSSAPDRAELKSGGESAPVAAPVGPSPSAPAPPGDPWAEMRELLEPSPPATTSAYVAATDAEVRAGFAEPTATQALAPDALTFELNGKPVVTAGITKETILKAFKLGALADELAGNGTAKNLLGSEFGVEHRHELTEPQGKAYVTALTKTINAKQRSRRGQ